VFQVQWAFGLCHKLQVFLIKLSLSKQLKYSLKQLQHSRLNPLAPVFAPRKQAFPNEVQMKIWEACTPGDRVIHIYPQGDLLRVVPGREDSIVEAASATRTSRAIVSKDYFLALGTRDVWGQGNLRNPKSTWFCPSRDTLFVHTPLNEGLEVLWQLLPSDERDTIHRLAIVINTSHNDIIRNFFISKLRYFPNIGSIKLIVDNTTMNIDRTTAAWDSLLASYFADGTNPRNITPEWSFIQPKSPEEMELWKLVD
jgi:hypothetical protein